MSLRPVPGDGYLVGGGISRLIRGRKPEFVVAVDVHVTGRVRRSIVIKKDVARPAFLAPEGRVKSASPGIIGGAVEIENAVFRCCPVRRQPWEGQCQQPGSC